MIISNGYMKKICVGIGALFRNGTIIMFIVLIWLSLSFGVYEFVMYYVGYMIKAAHIAIFSERCQAE